MTITWGDLNARARGLSTRLLSHADLAALALLPDLAALAEALRTRGYGPDQGTASPRTLELAVRRESAARLHVIARWSGPRTRLLGALFEDEDRRSLRATLRGARVGAPTDIRLAGLIPTPSLPERALRELARQRSPGAVAVLLTAWHHPYGSPLLEAALASEPDLLQLDLVVNRTWARRAAEAVRHVPVLAAYVRDVVDLENGYTALALAGQGADTVPDTAFLAGGRVSLQVFGASARAGDLGAAARAVAGAFAPTPLAAAFERAADTPATLEDAVLRAQIRNLKRRARTETLEPTPLLVYWLRLRAEGLDLRRLIWGLSLGAPRESLVESFASA